MKSASVSNRAFGQSAASAAPLITTTSAHWQNSGSLFSMVEARRVKTAATRGDEPSLGAQDQRSQS